jgi:hypothetical protein
MRESTNKLMELQEHAQCYIIGMALYLGDNPTSVRNMRRYVNQQADVRSFSICPMP